MLNLHPVTIAIIAANVLMSLKGFNDYNFRNKFLFNIGAIRRGEQIRVLSSAFLHANPQHLMFNMVTLFFFANAVIYRLGVVNFVIVYFGSLIFGSLLSYFMNKDNYHYSALGASGAVSGILYAAILLDPWVQINFIIPGWIFALGYMGYSIYGMIKKNDNIGHDAHFGGSIGGYILTVIMAQQHGYTLDPIFMVVLAIPIITLFILIKLKKV